jgi:hypothetical protein
VDARKLPAWGFYVRGVKQLTFENVHLTCARDDARPMFMADGVDTLKFGQFDYSLPASSPKAFVLKDVKSVKGQFPPDRDTSTPK